jgi:beta-lactam-binding protein with PASTA domain
MIGRILSGRYQIGERIGGGGMALVYRAKDLQLGRDVAVKVLRGQFGSDEDFIRRFRREAHNAASLSHPNVVQIFDVGHEDDQYFIVMELVEGQTLKELIQRQRPLPILDVCRIAVEVLSALDTAHRQHIIHRDIKPHNILIARNGRAKVTDFGIAHATTTDTVTHTGSILGSAHYFSPEQANGLPTGEKADLYSLGVVLYEMVTGALPFQGDSPITVALKHLRNRPVPPSQLNGEVPVELEAIILKALEKEPNDRFESAEAMRHALLDFGDNFEAGRTHLRSGDFPTMDLKGMRAHQEAFDEASNLASRLAPPRRRRRTWLWVSLVALLIVGLLGGAAWAVVKFLDVPEVAVPNVIGFPLAEAKSQMDTAHLQVKFGKERPSNTVERNHVIETEPNAGMRVKEGKEIIVVLSSGPDERTLPDVRGKTEDEARLALDNEGFSIGVVTPRFSRDVTEGRVIEMTPQPLTKIQSGSKVNLVISKGPLRVPKIIGKPLDQVKILLRDAGLTLGNITPLPDAKQPKDTVLSSDPPQDAPVTNGDTINVVVATAPPAVAPKPFTKEITVPGLPVINHDVLVTLVDVTGGVPIETTKFSGKRKAGDKVTVTGSFMGETAYLRVLVDGQEKQRIDLP